MHNVCGQLHTQLSVWCLLYVQRRLIEACKHDNVEDVRDVLGEGDETAVHFADAVRASGCVSLTRRARKC